MMQLPIPASSFLEYAFVRWVLLPATTPAIVGYVVPQQRVDVGDRSYRVDYEFVGRNTRISIELDGYAYHGNRTAFTYDRLRQNDLAVSGRMVLRFSYEAIRMETARCVGQLQAMLARDAWLASFINPSPVIERPDMDPDPLYAFAPVSPKATSSSLESAYFDAVRYQISMRPLRACQEQAFAALGNYYRSGGSHAACVMSVGAGKTALGVLATLAFTQRRALIVTPGSVIRGTFDRAFNPEAVGNVLYGLPGGPLIPGSRPPRVLSLDREHGAISRVPRERLLGSDVIVTNFHSLGTGEDPDDLLAKLAPDEIDFIVIDEAHIAASESYQRIFRHFRRARTILMSACFQRLDGKPIDADIVYRYRLIDSIADGNAKNLRLHRFAPETEQTTYEMVWPDGRREEIVGRAALLDLIRDERKLAGITARSLEPIRQVMRAVRVALDLQAELLNPVKPRVLFSALGERHAEQIEAIANQHGIPCDYLHHSMTEQRIKAIRARFEQDSGDLQGIVQLKMLGQGYDFPPITVVVPMRPYGSFSEFYQFIGRGIRVIADPALRERVEPSAQYLDIVYHAELGIDEHIGTLYRENDMDPQAAHVLSDSSAGQADVQAVAGPRGQDTAQQPNAYVLFERGTVERLIVHDEKRVEQRRQEREHEALAQRYAVYAQSTDNPMPFAQFCDVMRGFRG